MLRSAVVDLGSNSVRLVVFEGRGRTPIPIFNEKAVLRLGRGLQTTGRLNEDGVAAALQVMARFHAIGRAMGADPFEVLATAAVRDASNGPAFAEGLRSVMPGVPIRILTGEEEAAYSAEGLLCGIPGADGILADIGGGSLEVVRVAGGARGDAKTLPLGVIRLSDRAGGDISRARELTEADLAGVRWLSGGEGRDLYLVGGAWRALARLHMALSGYPISIVHQYILARDVARDMAGEVGTTQKRLMERMPAMPRKRTEDLPYAAVVLRRLLRATGARRVVFSACGLREGWYMRLVSPDIRAEDPLLAEARAAADANGRDPNLPPALMAWTAPLFAPTFETSDARRLREAACWLSDIGSHDHPEYRAEQSFMRVLHHPGVGIDHPSRAFIACVLAYRYEAEPDAPFLQPVRALLSPDAALRASTLGCALRLAYTLSAGTRALLAQTALVVDGSLVLRLAPRGSGVFAGDSVTRRLDRLGAAMGLTASTEVLR